MKNFNQNGFISTQSMIAIVFVIAIIGLAGWRVFSANNPEQEAITEQQVQTNQDTTARPVESAPSDQTSITQTSNVPSSQPTPTTPSQAPQINPAPSPSSTDYTEDEPEDEYEDD